MILWKISLVDKDKVVIRAPRSSICYGDCEKEKAELADLLKEEKQRFNFFPYY